MKPKDIKKGMDVIIREELEPAPAKPKYDPARKFRKGDRVRVVEWHGRVFGNGLNHEEFIGQEYIVEDDEYGSGDVLCDSLFFSACCLELIEPVDENKPKPPFIVGDYYEYSSVRHMDSVNAVAVFPYGFWSSARARKKAREYCDELNRIYIEKHSK